jgi:hypothetical protein
MFDTHAITKKTKATPRKHKFNICTKRSNGLVQIQLYLTRPSAIKLDILFQLDKKYIKKKC